MLLRLLQSGPRLHPRPRAGVPGGAVLGEGFEALGELENLGGLGVECVGRVPRSAVEVRPVLRATTTGTLKSPLETIQTVSQGTSVSKP
jgi:hypothetical protein